MEEQRQFFRVKNNGAIQARLDDELLHVIDISSTGILIITQKLDFPNQGIIELKIIKWVMNLSYELLRMENNKIVLTFIKEEEINKLFPVLKKLRDERL